MANDILTEEPTQNAKSPVQKAPANTNRRKLANEPAPKPENLNKRTLRKQAPRINVAEFLADTDERANILKSVKAKQEDSNEFHYCFQDPTVPEDVIRGKGYEPVALDGKQVRHGADPLYRIPQGEADKRRERAEAVSKAALVSALDPSEANRRAVDSSGQVHKLHVTEE